MIESTVGKDLAQRAKNAMAGVDDRDKSSAEAVFIQCAGLMDNICGLFAYAGIITLLKRRKSPVDSPLKIKKPLDQTG